MRRHGRGEGERDDSRLQRAAGLEESFVPASAFIFVNVNLYGGCAESGGVLPSLPNSPPRSLPPGPGRGPRFPGLPFPRAITSELYFARSFVPRFKTCHSALIMPNSVKLR
jgi:hypothetical protein